MGTRQTAQPLGVALAALGLPPLARRARRPPGAAVPGSAVRRGRGARLLLVPTRRARRARAGAPPATSPYRGSATLTRVHLASSMLVVPQFAVATFTLVYLVGQRHWDPAVAGRMIFGFQVAGAPGGSLSGVWSDRVALAGCVPMRQLAVASAGLMALIALGAATHLWFVIAGFGARRRHHRGRQRAGLHLGRRARRRRMVRARAGRAEHRAERRAVATAPVLAAVIGESRYALGFALVAVFPLLAIPLTPVRAVRAGRRAQRAVPARRRRRIGDLNP